MKTVTLETMRKYFYTFVKSVEQELKGTTIVISHHSTYPEWYSQKEISPYTTPLNDKLDRLTFTLEIINTKSKPKQKHEIVQLLNPRSHRYVKVDKTVGGIITHKKTPNPYKGIPIVSKDNSKRTIKSPPKPRPTSLRRIKEAVKKAPPERAKANHAPA